ncbi:hypothetical protein [Mycolicibacterium sp.]|uniref:hypothetical protein n=1 Tax=Mycolicibacterium sp. TaxID=2320850 RepID=UPI0037C9A05C
MRLRVAKALRRWADRLDPGPRARVNYSVNVNVGADVSAMRQEIQRAASRVG